MNPGSEKIVHSLKNHEMTDLGTQDFCNIKNKGGSLSWSCGVMVQFGRPRSKFGSIRKSRYCYGLLFTQF